ncbi:MAG TPA: hypothetical protein VNG51_19855 [Ktedonobacteraceae bacterium]|nr:hypothetical protein [Ktedonobacteraceae bacterium]
MMTVNNDASRRGTTTEGPGSSTLGWRELTLQRGPAHTKRRRLPGIMCVLLLILLIFAGVRISTVVSPTDDQLTVQIGNQQVAVVDLRQHLPISPDLFGANVGPAIGSSSQDNATGTTYYSPALTTGLKDANIGLLRFPGGSWGESHYLSLDQMKDFAALLDEVNSDGMMQARLSGPIQGSFPELTSLAQRATIAGNWVDFMNNPHSYLRVGAYAHVAYHPAKFWTVGDAPDTLINPATGKLYTVAEYVQDFIQFSTVMHQHDPNILVFGPDISVFNGPGAGPTDANGQLWMEGFLKGVGAYEQSHPNSKFQLLNGVSFHQYQFGTVSNNPAMLLSSTDQWNYLIPQLHQLIGQYLKTDVPIAITAINTNAPGQQAPAQGLASLWWADTLATLMEQQVAYAAFSSASGINSPYPLLTTQGQQQTAMLRVMQIFSHLQNNLIPVQTQRDPISFYATQDNAHHTVSLLFINKSNTPQLAEINSTNQFLSVGAWPTLSISIAGYSIVEITLHRGSGAEAYSYIPPTNNDNSVTPVLHTVCGNKSDVLANNIPC